MKLLIRLMECDKTLPYTGITAQIVTLLTC
jgi:hypothetical protein